MPAPATWSRCLLIAVAFACAEPLRASPLRPAPADRFFLPPHESAKLRWKTVSGSMDQPPHYTIRDYWGKVIASGRAGRVDPDSLQVTVRLARGFYDVEFAATGQRFGVICLPAYEGRPDPFFCIDSAMSWLVHDDRVREGLLKALRRSGVAMSRERLNWAEVNPARDSWDWEARPRYETVRLLHRAHGVEVLEMFHRTTPWAGNVGKYPEDLVGLARAWRRIDQRWRATWGGLEVWNEPDIFFGANLPADQYVPLVKTLAYALDCRADRVPLVGGVFAHCNRPFLDNAARNGLLQCVDAVSFHTYGRAPEMEALIGSYRSWLRGHARETMPLWITECGRPWSRGPDRPPVEQDALSALDIAMKAVESRACGIARHFCFVYPFFEERDHNFGMMGRRATPLRSMAAYAQLVRLLAHKTYLGDLACHDSAVERARVFGDGRETVAVLYTGRPDPEATVRLDLPLLRVEGIDGRRFERASQRTVPVPDGLTYIWLDPAKLGDRLQSDTPAARLGAVGRCPPPPRPAPSPVVLRFEADARLLESKTEGHRPLAAAPTRLPLEVRAFNLCERPLSLRLKLSFSRGVARPLGPAIRSIRVPPEASAEVTWQTDLGGAFAAGERLQVTVSAEADLQTPISPLVIDLAPEAGRPSVHPDPAASSATQ